MEQATFAAIREIAEDKTKSPGEAFHEAIKRYQFDRGEPDYSKALRAVAEQFPKLHRKYLDETALQRAEFIKRKRRGAL